MITISKCTAPSRRHVWQHVKNLTRTSTTPSTAHIRLVGRYRCNTCGMHKDGPPDLNQAMPEAELSKGGAA